MSIWILSFVVFLAQGSTPASKIIGSWHGTSLCADKARDPACHDEEVVYDLDSAATSNGPVRWVADKIVNGVRDNMGVMRLAYDSATHVWSADIHMRLSARWSLEPKGDTMTGTLVQLPSGRLVRRVAVQRVR